MMKNLKQKVRLIASSIFILAIIFSLNAFIFSITIPPVYGQTTNAWNLQRSGAGNDLNVYYNNGSNQPTALQLNTTGDARVRRLLDLDDQNYFLNPNSTSVLNTLGVGIGTVTGTNRMIVKSVDNGGATNIFQTLANNETIGIALGYDAIRMGGSATNSKMTIDAKGNGHLVLQTTATNTANVGIGVTAPVARLDVFGLGSSHAAIRGVTSGAYPGVLGSSTTASHVGVMGTSVGNTGVWGNDETGTGVAGTSTSGVGISGSSSTNIGIAGASTSNVAVRGISSSSYGVYGLSTSGTGVRGESTSQPGIQGYSTSNAGIYGYSTNNDAGFFHSGTGARSVYIRSDSGSAGSTTQIDRYTDAGLGGGSLLTLHNYGPRNDTSGFFIAATSDVNNNQGGVDLEFYVRGDGHVWADGAFNPNGADIAEWVPSDFAKELEAGDLVMVDGSSSTSLTKKSNGTPYSSKIMGIVSSAPGIVTGSKQNELDHLGKDVMVTMSGRVPTKVTTENGEIKPGDHLTSSSTPGVAMKATKAGIVVGKALEGYNKEGIGKIEVWVQSFWYGGDNNQQLEIDQLKKDISELRKLVEEKK